MSDKYIIKNCPATYKKLRINENNEVYIDEYRCNYQTLNPCQDCTDCVMKQIVELAKGYKEELIDRKTKKVVATRYFKLTKEILELLEIGEVE